MNNRLKHLMALCLLSVCGITAWADNATTKTPVGGYPQFALGVDASWTSRIEDGNLFTYYRTSTVADGEITTIPAMISDYGMDAVRLRVWVDPTNSVAKDGFAFKVGTAKYESIGTQGYCGKDDVVSLARRFACQGQRIMVAFQMSDTWADPARQFIPQSWASCTTFDELKAKAVEHVSDVLQALHDANVNVAWVQIGNETNTGMLKYQLPSGQTSSTQAVTSVAYGCEIGKNTTTTKNFVDIFEAASQAAKAIYPDAKTVLHLARTAQWSNITWTMNYLKNAGFSTEMCDLIGLSLYPGIDDSRDGYTAEWQTYADLGLETIEKLYTTYGYPSILCEIGMNNEYSYSADIDNTAAADLQQVCIEQCNKDVKAFTQYLIDNLATADSHCEGLFYWEPEGDYIDSYTKGACVSVNPGSNWPRDKVTANQFWYVCQQNSSFPSGGLTDYVLNSQAEPTPLYVAGDFNSWNYASPTEFAYSSQTGLYTATIDCTSDEQLSIAVSTEKGSETDFTSSLYAPVGSISNGITACMAKASASFSLPYAAKWDITVNPARGTINFYTTTEGSTTVKAEDLYLYVYDKTGAEELYIPLLTSDGIIYSETSQIFPNSSTNLDLCVTTKDWSSTWRSPNGQWIGINRDEETTLTKGGPNNCYIWGWTLAASDYVWFNAQTGHLLITSSATCPWTTETTGKQYSLTYDNSQTQWAAVYAYVLDSNGLQLCGAWPGKRMAATDETDIFKLTATLSAVPATVSFSDGLNRSATFDFVDGQSYTAIKSIPSADGAATDAQPTYYTLQGMRVSHPTRGIYIEKKGGKSKKVIF